MGVGPNHQDAQLHKAGDDGGPSGTHYAQLRRAEVAENQDIVADEVDQHGDDARHHGRLGASRLAQGTAITLGEGEGNQSDEHHLQIFLAVVQGGGGIFDVAFALQVEVYQRLSPQ